MSEGVDRAHNTIFVVHFDIRYSILGFIAMQMRKRVRADVTIPTASMADIAFLLIVFFLVTTTLHRDKGIGMDLPPMGEGKKVPRRNICNVWINAAGEIAVEGEILPLSQLRGNVKMRLSQNENLIMSLKADRDTPYDAFINVLDELKLADASRISIASPEQ